MFCEKCGAEVKEGARFCPKCGAPIVSDNSSERKVEPQQDYKDTLNADKNSHGAGNHKTAWIILAIVIIAAVIVIIVLGLSRRSSVKETDAMEELEINSEESEPYFVSHNIEIDPTGDCTIYTIGGPLDDDETESVWGWVNGIVNIETVQSDEAGYVDTTITLSNLTSETEGTYNVIFKLYDYYTGQSFDSMDTYKRIDDDDVYKNSVMLNGVDGEIYDIYYTDIYGEDLEVYQLTVHHPIEYDGTVFAIVGGASVSSDLVENGLDLETGNEVLNIDMADSQDWVKMSDGSSVDVDEISNIDIHFFKDGIEGDITPRLVKDGIEFTSIDDSHYIETDIVADDGTPGTVGFSIYITRGVSASASSKSEWAQSVDDNYKCNEVNFIFSNVKFEDGEDHDFTWYYAFLDYYTGNTFKNDNMVEQDGLQISYMQTFTTWDGRQFDYWIETSVDTDIDSYSCTLYCPDWYDGIVFSLCLNPDATVQERLYFSLMD